MEGAVTRSRAYGEAGGLLNLAFFGVTVCVMEIVWHTKKFILARRASAT
jgi:hypothetical protein